MKLLANVALMMSVGSWLPSDVVRSRVGWLHVNLVDVVVVVAVTSRHDNELTRAHKLRAIRVRRRGGGGSYCGVDGGKGGRVIVAGAGNA